jgi:DNA-directed DNA polymerase III PolC
MPRPFTHLHVHTEYSKLDGASRLADLVQRCTELGMTHLAITDHGNLHGAYGFFHAAVKGGITPVIGMEAYVAPASRRSPRRTLWGTPHQKADDVSAGGAYTHMTVWAVDSTGLRNLIKVSSRAWSEGFLTKWPRMDDDLAAQHADGLVASTGCPSGEVQTRLRLGQDDLALAAAAKWRDIYGTGNYYLELMDHGNPIEKRVRDGLLDIGRKLSIPPLVTNDSHYTYPEEQPAHDALLCLNTGSQLADPKRFRFDGMGYHLRSPDEMYDLDSSDVWQQGCANTMDIAHRVDTTGMFAEHNLMPRWEPPAGHDECSWFRHEAETGMAARLGGTVPAEYSERLSMEIDTICRMGFPSYFLVVADFVQWAKQRGIMVGPGRGSAAGCLVAYAMGIIDIDPVRFGLLFERFLNPDRVSMPDIDIDFDDRRRGEVIRYVTDKYGADKVSMIGTFGCIKSRNAVKDAARVLGYPYAMGDRIAKAMPPDKMGKGAGLSVIDDPQHPRHAEAAELRGMYQDDKDVKTVIDLGRGLEGLFRQPGVHAAGILMSSEPITDHVPTWTRMDDGATITQWDQNAAEAIGFLKMDFLGLRNLGIITDALATVKERTGRTITPLTVPLDDVDTYRMIAKGDTLGVFQLDGGGLRALLRQMRPDTFDDIIAAISLYRPGPMGVNAHISYALRKNGKQDVTPIHPDLADALAEVLEPTYGLIVYQEQVMQAARIIAGYSLSQADLLRRAMGKKKKDILDKEYLPFRDGARSRGYSDASIQVLWDTLVPFADYAFNRCTTGDTVITRLGRGKSPWPQTVENIANRVHGRPDYDGRGCAYCYTDTGMSARSTQCRPCKSWRAKWRMSGGINAAGRVGDRVLPVKITDVFRQGVKPVWKMTLASGAHITTTMNHRHLTPGGWRQLSELAVGDNVCVMGTADYSESPRTEHTGGKNWTALHGYETRVRSDGRPGPFLHGRSSDFKRIVAGMERKCKKCGTVDGSIEVAHLDGDPFNNTAENLAYLCNSDHKKHDYALGARVPMWRKGRPVESSPIVSIDYVGEEMTYDVTVDSEDHSWIANDSIVTHNSHGAGYAYVAYWTAYLKANYPAEYMAAVLTSVGADKDKMSVYLAECARMRIKVRQPDINDSGTVFLPVADDEIRYGMTAVHNVGAGVVDAIIGARRAGGRFTSFHDFLSKAPLSALSKKATEALIKAGAFDSLGHSRRVLYEQHDVMIDAVVPAKKQEEHGQDGLFGLVGDDEGGAAPVAVAAVPLGGDEWDRRTLLSHEREMLGRYVSDHPLSRIAHRLRSLATAQVADLYDESRQQDEVVSVAGIVTGLTRKITKKGNPWAVFQVEDLTGSVEVLCFPASWQLVCQQVADDLTVCVKGRLDRQEGSTRLIVSEVRMPDLSDDDAPLVITVHDQSVVAGWVRRLRRVLDAHPGTTEVRIKCVGAHKTMVLRLDNIAVDRSAALMGELKQLLGAGNIA